MIFKEKVALKKYLSNERTFRNTEQFHEVICFHAIVRNLQAGKIFRLPKYN